MLDFLLVSTRAKKGSLEIYPKFKVVRSKDLMIRGGDFYAIWDEAAGLWSDDMHRATELIDQELDEYYKANKDKLGDNHIKIAHLWDSETGMIDTWLHYCQRQMPDSYSPLNEQLIFANTPIDKKMFASKRLPYPLEAGSIDAYDELMSVLYSPEERMKIEWAIGAIVSGESKQLQKFMVLYGSAGTGKSTVLNIIQMLFTGYYSVFDAKALGSNSNAFALEAFKTNPLVAIQHDGDLSHIEDNTRLNSVVSHELMTVNEKFKSAYSARFKAFLFLGTNRPVKITDAKSGLIRRLIDVSPTGQLISQARYDAIMHQIPFELGAIAWHCKDIYISNKGLYDKYVPNSMLGATNDFYNFVLDSFDVFSRDKNVTLKKAWEMYKVYAADANMAYSSSMRVFKEELKNYFEGFEERYTDISGQRLRNVYIGFLEDKFVEQATFIKPVLDTIPLNCTSSLLDILCQDCPAQYANTKETPTYKWDKVTTTLKDLDTTKLHYVKVPENLIVIDFDLKDSNGKKSRDRNLAEASKWPPTYTEFSKSGEGVHLHYIYDGDTSKLSTIYAEGIEIKIFRGMSSLRRKLTYCNDLEVAHINSGLPERRIKVVSMESVQSEKKLRELIIKNLHKEIHPNTKPSIDFIFKILDDAYKSDLKYDVSDLRNSVLHFAASSHNQADICVKMVAQMHFKSDDISENTDFDSEEKITFYDVEVFPNLFLVNWKLEGEEHSVVRMINPTSEEIENLCKHKLVGFNNRRYDNHMLYARLIGYSNEQLYELSQKIISGSPNCFFGEAYNISYTDIYDFSSKKQSLKKFEIELGIHHQELGLPWDQPVPEDMWYKVAEYCDNDVIATEAVFNARKADFTARLILADVAGMTPNDTTNSLTTRIIFGKERHPQSEFNYRNMGLVTKDCAPVVVTEDGVLYHDFGSDGYTVFDDKNRPVFPGYKYESGKSTYRGEEVGEGGYVYAEPGMYKNVALLDIASMHPHSILAEDLFGPYTQRFRDIVQARIAIKHKDWDSAKKMLDGKLAKYLDDPGVAKDLAQALKIAINSVYGLTSAKFECPFRDIRNVDNIVAKRGALFMVNLKHEVQAKGFTVAHIKTDSIKIPNATPEIIQFVMDYGKMYGYSFEHEATYDRMCLVNDAVYIAKYAQDEEHPDGKWTATGAEFAVPYVFKTLFSKESVTFEDLCETKSVSSSLYLDMNEGKPEDEHDYHFVGKVGSFCPIKPGCGGGLLMREAVDANTGEKKYVAATGSKGYRWLEAEMVRNLHKEDDIDMSYYISLADDSANKIAEYGDLYWFTDGYSGAAPYQKPDLPWAETTPYDVR